MSAQTWTVAEAKAKFSELIDKAKSEGPQKITKHGRTTAVVVAAEECGLNRPIRMSCASLMSILSYWCQLASANEF